jgi:hypothetical protein
LQRVLETMTVGTVKNTQLTHDLRTDGSKPTASVLLEPFAMAPSPEWFLWIAAIAEGAGASDY